MNNNDEPVDPLALVKDFRRFIEFYDTVKFNGKDTLGYVEITGKDAVVHFEFELEAHQTDVAVMDVLGAAITRQPLSPWWLYRPDKLEWLETSSYVEATLHYTLEFTMQHGKLRQSQVPTENDVLQAVWDFASTSQRADNANGQ